MALFSSHAKCIVSGEHIVAFGGKAIAIPVNNFKMLLNVQDSTKLKIIQPNSSDEKKRILHLLKKASEFLNISFEKITGNISIKNTIPICAGLGSSAALCVNTALFMESKKYCPENLTFDLAKNLENTFHEKSSGLDIAVTMLKKFIVFENHKVINVLEPKFWPHMMLSFCGVNSKTSECSKIVKELFDKNNDIQHETSEMMNYSVNICELAFQNSNFEKLKEGINVALKCFQIWGLCNNKMNEHINLLYSLGAVAVKPIGSGLGGYILSLWNKKIENSRNIGLTLKKV